MNTDLNFSYEPALGYLNNISLTFEKKSKVVVFLQILIFMYWSTFRISFCDKSASAITRFQKNGGSIWVGTKASDWLMDRCCWN